MGSGILKVAGTERKQVKFRNISLYFAIDMEQTGEKSYGKGREAGVKGTGGGSKRYGRREVQTPLSPPTIPVYTATFKLFIFTGHAF